MAYVPASDKVLVAKGCELKLVARRPGSRSTFFDEPGSTHFGNAISEVSDEISLFLNKADLSFVLQALDFSRAEDQSLVGTFLARLLNDFDGQSVRVPYIVALVAIKSLVAVALR